MRWLAIGLALVAAVLSMLSVAAGLVGILPAPGSSEAFFRLGSVCLTLAVGAALAATALGATAFLRDPGPKREVSSVIALATSTVSLVASLGLVAFVIALTEAGKDDQRKIEEGRTHHQAALTAAEIAGARPTTAEVIVSEWTRDRDASDRVHRGEVLRLTFRAGGGDWVDGADCVSLLGRRNVVCCLAGGQAIPTGDVELVGRYAGTDRRYSTPGKDQGKLVFDSCQTQSIAP